MPLAMYLGTKFEFDGYGLNSIWDTALCLVLWPLTLTRKQPFIDIVRVDIKMEGNAFLSEGLPPNPQVD